jgi:hypothetical protein
MGLLQENRKYYVESDLAQNLTEEYQVIIKEEGIERALKFKKNTKLSCRVRRYANRIT